MTVFTQRNFVETFFKQSAILAGKRPFCVRVTVRDSHLGEGQLRCSSQAHWKAAGSQ